MAVAGSVARLGDVRGMVEAGNTFGGINVLVNNAGIFPRVDFLQMTEAQWDDVLNVNLKGTFFCSQTVVRQLVERGKPGSDCQSGVQCGVPELAAWGALCLQ